MMKTKIHKKKIHGWAGHGHRLLKLLLPQPQPGLLSNEGDFDTIVSVKLVVGAERLKRHWSSRMMMTKTETTILVLQVLNLETDMKRR